jgi:hypothetical protein
MARNVAVRAELDFVSVRTLVLVAFITALVGAGIGATSVLFVVERGPAGPAGHVGPRGPQGPEGDTSVSADDVRSAVDDDPDAVAASLSGHLDYEDIQQNLDPDPSDVQSDLESVRSALDDLCSQLSLSDALSNDFTSC